jgi:hypothetical protein
MLVLHSHSGSCFPVGAQRAVGVNAPDEALLFVILSPVGPYYPRGFKPISLFGTTEFIRAAPGGMSRALTPRHTSHWMQALGPTSLEQITHPELYLRPWQHSEVMIRIYGCLAPTTSLRRVER